MDSFRVESVLIKTAPGRVFHYIADPKNLPEWTNAFKSARNGKAIIATPAGTVEVGLEVKASSIEGTVDWQITFPDGSIASAYSRVLPISGQSAYSFMLMAPPVPLEQLEGALNQQVHILRDELAKLKAILSAA